MRITKHVLKRSHTKKQWEAVLKKCDLKPITLGNPTVDDSDLDDSVFRPEPVKQ